MSARPDPGPDPAVVDGGGSSALRRELGEAAVESRWEAAPAVVVVIGLQLVLAIVSEQQGWKLRGLPWWVWLLPVARPLQPATATQLDRRPATDQPGGVDAWSG